MNLDSQSNVQKEKSLASAKQVLEEIGINEARLYDHSPVLRVQVPESVFDRALRMREAIADQLKAVGYRFIALDLSEKDD